MRIILFGSTGMLGRYVYSILKEHFTVICITRDEYNIEDDDFDRLDKMIVNNLTDHGVIINCAGIIPQKICLHDYKKYIKVNTLFPLRLAQISKQHSLYLIHITTDCVFDGSKGHYTIYDNHTARDIYGISKSLGESEDATIIRTSIIGEELSGKKSLIEWIISNRDSTINGFVNHYWNGVTCLSLAKIIKQIIEDKNFWRGVKHIFSNQIVTKYDLCKYINDIYELNIDVIPYENGEPKDMTLDGEIFFNIDHIYDQIKEQKEYKLV